MLRLVPGSGGGRLGARRSGERSEATTRRASSAGRDGRGKTFGRGREVH